MNQLLKIRDTKDQSTKIVRTDAWTEKTPLAVQGKSNLFLAVRPGKPGYNACLILLTQEAHKMVVFDRIYVEPRYRPPQFYWKNHGAASCSVEARSKKDCKNWVSTLTWSTTFI